ncbi:hypothetical protein [Psychrobacter sp. AOP7-A1-24]|uniref:hypothetical protein n=1 Tax=Psychrobacter sp. AOP7-A1-24 TaxID=3457646 RepID=UPI00402BD161
MLSKTDSANEQAKETPIASKTKKINKEMLSAVGAAAAVDVDTAPAAHTVCGSMKIANTESAEKEV